MHCGFESAWDHYVVTMTTFSLLSPGRCRPVALPSDPVDDVAGIPSAARSPGLHPARLRSENPPRVAIEFRDSALDFLNLMTYICFVK